MSIGIGVVADDFTGGLYIASKFEQLGIRVACVTDPDCLPDLGDQAVVVIPTRIRFMPAQDAVALMDRLTTALDRCGTRQCFYKYCNTFDSNDDGNIGPCADLLAQKYALPRLVFSPAYPDSRSYVLEGYMFYKDRLISESIKRFDPITPMSDPDLARVLQRQTREKVGNLPHRILFQGLDAARAHVDELTGRGTRYILMDGADPADIACGAELFEQDRVATGSDALVIELAKRQRDRMPSAIAPRQPIQHARGASAVLVGSCSDITLDQLADFEQRHPVLRLDILQDEPENLSAQALEWASAHLHSGKPVAISVATNAAGFERTQKALGVLGAARKAETILAHVARGLFDRGVRRFVVAGGETSGAVVTALGIRRLHVLPFDELGAGSCIALDPEPVSLFLKPGKVGGCNLFTRALEKFAQGSF